VISLLVMPGLDPGSTNEERPGESPALLFGKLVWPGKTPDVKAGMV